MKKFILLFLLLSNVAAFSQEDAWVYFNTKPDSQAYLDNPLTMLTQRALNRRTIQNISLDIKDVPIYQPYIDQTEAAMGITVKAKSKWFNAVHVQGSQADIQALSALTFVDRLDFANRSLNTGGRAVAPPARKFSKTANAAVIFNYGNSYNQIQMLNGDLLHQQDYTGDGKVIAVMDGGFPGVNTASTFSRLRDNNLILGGYDYVNRNPDFYAGISHGTMVLSTMGGFKDGQLVGTAPDASYYLFITEDGNNEGPLEMSLWVEAAEEADRIGVDIITTSLGYTRFDDANYDFTYEDMNGTTAYISKGVDIAFSRGIICVVSAGNEGNSDWHYISAPADAQNALSVGAVKADETPATFSSYGPSFDGRVKPDVAAQGQQSVLSNASGGITTASGTSFSGPILAGMVASLWEAVPNKTNAEIVQYIKESASIYATPNDRIGYGIPDFNQALMNALGTTSFSNTTRFAVYPNPAHSQVSIAFPNGFEFANVTFYNILGQRVLEQPVFNSNPVIFLDALNSGIYLYKIQTNTISQSGKMVKH